MNVRIACSLGARLRGLLGEGEYDGALLLAPCNDIHTFGMRRPIDVAFVSPEGIVIQSHRMVGTRQRIRCKNAAATIERFSTEEPWFEFGEHIQLEKDDGKAKGGHDEDLPRLPRQGVR